MSFAPQMHGFYGTPMPFTQTFMDLTEDTAKKIATLQAKLDRKLGPEYISTRPGPGGGPKLTYAEGWKIINLANEVFGFNGWSSSVVNLTTDYVDFNEESKRYNVGVTAVVRVTLRDGVYHEDVGYGNLENSKTKGPALDKCKKEAVTDAVKRALRNFGNLLGNCLYDKQYAQEVVKIKVPPPKFDRSELHRRPEFDENRAGPSSTTAGRSAAPAPVVKPEPTSNFPVPAVSSNMRSNPNGNGNQSGMGAGAAVVNTPNNRGNSTSTSNTGLHTPAYTPAGARAAVGNVHGQPQPQMQNQGQPQRQAETPAPADRRVSFAPQPAAAASTSASTSRAAAVPSKPAPAAADDTMDDDSFHFNSEDDAFLATVDLGDEGLGGPIHFDEGAGGVDGSVVISAEPPVARPRVLSERAASIAAQLEADQQLRDAQDHDRQWPQHNPAETARPPMRSVQPVPQQQPSCAVLTPQQAMPPPDGTAHKAHTSGTDQNIPPNGNQTSVRNNATSRSSTPSVGGFNFPPGMAPQQQKSGTLAPPRYPGQAQGSGSGIGLKRSADIMQAHSANKRPAQGMGLMAAGGFVGSHTSGARREPFAQLDLGEGGDVKRPRR